MDNRLIKLPTHTVTLSYLFSIYEDIQSHSYEGFPNKYLPYFQVHSDGSIFIKTHDHDLNAARKKELVFFLLLDKDLKPTHDTNYPFARIPKEGYLARLVQNSTSKEISVSYIINIADIIIHPSIASNDPTEYYERLAFDSTDVRYTLDPKVVETYFDPIMF